MLYLSQKKLDLLLGQKGLTLSGLARAAGISRQSLYRYFQKEPVFAIPFQKILRVLSVPYPAITEERNLAESILSKAPFRIQKVARALIEFAEKEGGALILFGSRTGGHEDLSRDWDFGLLLPRHNPATERRFKLLRQEITERAFPHRIDLVNLNLAPRWFLETVARSFVCLHGNVTADDLLKGKAA